MSDRPKPAEFSDQELLREVASRLMKKATPYRLSAIDQPGLGDRILAMHQDSFIDNAVLATVIRKDRFGIAEVKFDGDLYPHAPVRLDCSEHGIWAPAPAWGRS